jgi:hypothetical protein
MNSIEEKKNNTIHEAQFNKRFDITRQQIKYYEGRGYKVELLHTEDIYSYKINVS